jgi:thioredoxin-related protein
VCLSIIANAQTSSDLKTINFEENLSWEQIVTKAKAENKYIFVDVFATWCMPCKQMDKAVYTSEEVAQFANKRFISVKVQIDTTKNDNAQVKKWYSVSHDLRLKYKIYSFPSFLFFSPEGKIVDYESGFHPPSEFRQILENAIDPGKQLYTLLGKYNKGEKNYKEMPLLAKKVASLLNDQETAARIAKDYNQNYFNKLSNEQLLTKENLEFITWNPRILRSKDKYFKIFMDSSSKIDGIARRIGFAEDAANEVISREEIWSKIMPDGKAINTEPNWSKLSNAIQKKYGKAYADKNILGAKIYWYSKKKDYFKTIKYNVEKIETYGIDTTFWGRFFLNNMVYDLILFHCDDTAVLKKSIKWMEIVLDGEHYGNGESIDTYANLLYRVGRKEEAIKWQEKAVVLNPEEGEIKKHLAMMKNNQPTWIAKK